MCFIKEKPSWGQSSMTFEQMHTLSRVCELAFLTLHTTKMCGRCGCFCIKWQALNPVMVKQGSPYTLMKLQCHNIILSLSNGVSNSSFDQFLPVRGMKSNQIFPCRVMLRGFRQVCRSVALQSCSQSQQKSSFNKLIHSWSSKRRPQFAARPQL